MILGHVIKRERKKQNLKQSHLAAGVCSPSHLSKIENNETSPSDEVVAQLFQKLGIKMDAIPELSQPSIEEKLLPELLTIYREVTENRNKEYIQEKIGYLFDNRLLYTKKEIFYMYNLVMLRLLLSTSSHLQKVHFYLQPLLDDRDSLDAYQSFLLCKIEGMYAFHLKKYKQAKVNFDAAYKLSYRLRDGWELADFYYMYALIHVVNEQNASSIEYSQKALHFYIGNFQFERVIECYTLQGIAYKRIKKCEESMQVYRKIESIIERFNLKEYERVLFQNIGCLYVALGDFQKAIMYYKRSLARKTELEEKLLSIFSIVRSYSRLHDGKSVREWIKKGLDLLEGRTEPIIYMHHLLFYREIYSEEMHLQVKQLTSIVQYFSEIEDYRHAYKYSMKIGELLMNRKKYKDASHFYKLAMEYNHIYRGVRYWEDI
ncbi:helix-turn-helix domain-containing protein [Priestia taiwanensis]|uniref:HTH cro/C1-type domain-containing protein n=1 Tax=Priestia taiwanensis TaxID=1347902 RepID=A0A917ETL2_9BACI|nr:helix-turn-helix domain-containing protein [Priestia taiwanensis]MBM7364764.1 transcriptional regulator with XRE-family HTH domain/uncharacterized protein HemY [Priestia taiwanensis]GGE79428.1 hypothetical protein GCM10007140_31280 [Priestia taiwanensis]